VDIEHRAREAKAIKANALLGFDYDTSSKDHHSGRGGGRGGKGGYQKVEIKDSEGVDFSFYFSEKYNLVHEKRKKELNRDGGGGGERGGYQGQQRGGGRGRGDQNYRGGRGGRGGDRGDRGGGRGGHRGGRGGDNYHGRDYDQRNNY
jgi:hypothetical protein